MHIWKDTYNAWHGVSKSKYTRHKRDISTVCQENSLVYYPVLPIRVLFQINRSTLITLVIK